MAKKTYAEKLRDPRWQKRRLEILEKSGFTCLCCGDGENELHVHHLLYEKGKEPWDYPDNLLLPLCAECHESVDGTQKDIVRLLAGYPPTFLGDLHMALCDLAGSWESWDKWIKAARPQRAAPKR